MQHSLTVLSGNQEAFDHVRDTLAEYNRVADRFIPRLGAAPRPHHRGGNDRRSLCEDMRDLVAAGGGRCLPRRAVPAQRSAGARSTAADGGAATPEEIAALDARRRLSHAGGAHGAGARERRFRRSDRRPGALNWRTDAPRRVLPLGGGVGVSAALGTRSRLRRARPPPLPLPQLLRTGDIGGLPWVELPLDGPATRWLVDSGASIALVALRWRRSWARAPRRPARGRRRRRPCSGCGLARRRCQCRQLRSARGGRGARPGKACSARWAFNARRLISAPWLRERRHALRLRARRAVVVRRCSAPGPVGVLPLRWDAGLPGALAGAGRRRAEPFLFDTGNAGALVLFAAPAYAAGATALRLPSQYDARAGRQRCARCARIERVSAAGWTCAAAGGLSRTARRANAARFRSPRRQPRLRLRDRCGDAGRPRAAACSSSCPACRAGTAGGRLRPAAGPVVPRRGRGGVRRRSRGGRRHRPGQWLLGLGGADARGWPPEQVWQRQNRPHAGRFALGTGRPMPRRAVSRCGAGLLPLWR